MKKIVLFGELMLRLKPAGKERFFQSSFLESVFGGSEANVSLSIFGKKTVYVTALPDNAVGRAAGNSLRYYGVDVQSVVKQGRLGIYFLEDGGCQRPSQVIYDRDGSCFAVSCPDEYDWKSVFAEAGWFHVSGVSPAVSENSMLSVVRGMEEAKKAGTVISLDLNYRKKLWKYGKAAKDVMTELAKMADVLIVIDAIKEWLQMDEEKLKYAIDVKLNRFMKANDLHYNYERRQIEYGSKEESL